MWHTLAFYKADVAGATNEQIPAVRDQIVTVSPNGNYILQQDMLVRSAYFRDAGAVGARLNTPQYRLVSIPNIHPVQRQSGVTNLPAYQRKMPSGLIIPRIDELIFEGSNNGAGGVAAVGGLWISPPGDNINVDTSGQPYKLHATGTSSGVAAQWELVPMTFDEVLPAGNYDIIGLDVVHSGTAGQCEFARLAWTGGGGPSGGGPQWRPGVIALPGFAVQSWEHWQNGNWGKLGSFASTAQPQLEVFSVTGTALTFNVYLDVILRSRGQ